MASMGFFQRIYNIIYPSTPAKQDGAIRMGLLGASNIAPESVINPAKSHPEVIIAAVAARDADRAHQYAKRYNIPIVHASYQELLDDPTIDAVYIALPNSHHYEWALRSLQAGKHVLLEKPSCSNATEARRLFTHPLATTPDAPILLEAFHYQFHPAWQKFLSLTRQTPWGPGTVTHAASQFHLPKGFIARDDIRFQYALSGGCLMDLATYPLSCVRQVLNLSQGQAHEDEEDLVVVEGHYAPLGSEHDPSASPEVQIDTAISATYQTADGLKTAHIAGDLAYTAATAAADAGKNARWPFFASLLPSAWIQSLPGFQWPKTEATLAEILVASQGGTETQHYVQRRVTIWNMILPTVYHRIDVRDTHTLYRQGKLSKTWEETQYLQAYNWPAGDARAETYREWWTTWRCQLEEFVHRIKGRQGSGVWVVGAESIRQMEAIDRTYRQVGLEARPTSAFGG
ncbi:Gfo/Idh/MocA family protein [Aspergillus saccharolyticus JOP 1030-1]|uniref:D-xylose 1-dehydrogenase (NADP(+), D-xylono-1,5-lactone-forming) n=1 Tax=Aspergillus saccharolyticus JOP 1030-1 TaxID=1450539 RepID=A0A318ZCX0_9EURO|nr:NAD(P)-binding protein [Aspergillus saccharolyticus JOP 1030-1]PYH45326.1 NAD(P)-binding protein [Aspergillus saccharolyticus JOP 1030-1]